MLKDIIPTAWRQRVYVAYALIVVLEGALQVGYATIAHEMPVWLLVALAVTAYLGAAIGAMAASNPTQPVPADATPPVIGE